MKTLKFLRIVFLMTVLVAISSVEDSGANVGGTAKMQLCRTQPSVKTVVGSTYGPSRQRTVKSVTECIAIAQSELASRAEDYERGGLSEIQRRMMTLRVIFSVLSSEDIESPVKARGEVLHQFL